MGSTSSGIKISTIRCPNCGTSLNLGAAKVTGIVCSNCGSIFDAEKLEVLTKGAFKPESFPSRSFIRLGLTGTFDGKQYQVIGRISYKASIREWDGEDSQYCTESWSWDEWTLVGEQKDYIYLQEDDEGYSLARSFVPTNPEPPEREIMNLEGGTPLRVQELGTARGIFYEGEFTWIPGNGETVQYAEYTVGGVTYSVENRKDNQGEVLEVEFFKAVPFTEIDLLRAFDFKEEIRIYEQKEVEKRQYAHWSNLFLAVAFLLLLVSLVSSTSKGRELFKQNINLASLNSDEGVVVGPFDLSKVGTVHNLRLSASIPDNSEAWAAVELLEDEDTAVNEFEGDFWRESGYDDEGNWSEADTVKDNYFRLEQPGEYFARVIGSPGLASNFGTVQVSVYEGIVLVRYFILAAILSLSFGVAIRARNSLNPFWIIGGTVLILIAAFVWIKEHRSDDDD